MTTQPPDRLFRPVSPAAQAKGERVFCAAVALLLVLSEVFSSNIQNTLPTFSHVCRIAASASKASSIGDVLVQMDMQRRDAKSMCAALP